MDQHQRRPKKSTLSGIPANGLYVLIEWPWSQELMGYPWFREECYLLQAFDDQPHLDSAYFVPHERLLELLQPE